MKNKKKSTEVKVTLSDLVVVNQTRTKTSKDVRLVLQDMGDSLKTTYDRTADVKTAQSAISAYSAAISLMKAQLIYKKMTGSPGRIDFFEVE